jgi:predicted deacylase
MSIPVRDLIGCPGALIEVFRIGEDAGPRVSVLGGIHGDEIEGVLAARRLLEVLSGCRLRGQVTVVPVANPAAFELSSRCGPDGMNLARVFPGNEGGTVSERLAHLLTAQVISGTSLLIDIHSAGRHYRMPGFCGYPAYMNYGIHSCQQLAERTGFATVWGHQQIQPGRSISAAQDLGIPWLYFESGGGGGLVHSDLDASAAAALTVLATMGVVDRDIGPAAVGPEPVHVSEGDGDVDSGLTFTEPGLFIAHVSAGDEIGAGDLIGEVVTPGGVHAEWIRCPWRGRLMMIRHTCLVEPGDLAALVAPAVPETS